MPTALIPREANILRAFRATTPQDRANGREWYAQAHALALELTPDNVRKGAGVIAALSPRRMWITNMHDAQRAVAQGYADRTLQRSIDQANRILAGEDPDSVLTGPKVRAFYANIVSAGQDDNVTVDMHAWNVAVGAVTDVNGLHRPGAYDRVAQLYRRAAKRVSRETGEHWTPAELQAATWIFWRREMHAPVLAAAKAAGARNRRMK